MPQESLARRTACRSRRGLRLRYRAPRKRSIRIVVPALAAVLVIAVLVPAGCGGSTQAEKKAPRQVYGQWVSTLKESRGDSVSVAAGGDVNFGDGVTPTITSNGVDYPWVDATKVFALADVSFVNLECALSTGGSPVSGKEYTFRGPPDAASGMAQAGVKVVSLANNHSKDWGTQAFLDTLTALQSNGIACCGAGKNSVEAFTPAILDAGGRKVAFVGFDWIVPDGWVADDSTPGVAAAYNNQKIADTIRKAADSSDFVVATYHWGTELATSPDSEQRSLAHLSIESGADLVLGHHPHVVQGFEVYRNKLIAYSLGNFVFSPPREISAKTVSIVVVMGPDGLVQAKVIPMMITGCRPMIMSDSAGAAWLSTVQGYSKEFGTAMEVRGNRGYINGVAPLAPSK